jgi:hypothetical protein
MEDEGILDPLNDLHLFALHYVYNAKIQEKLTIWCKAWSQHRMRTTRSSPIKMWVAGQLQNPMGIELESAQMFELVMALKDSLKIQVTMGAVDPLFPLPLST